jgi:hypothetical protein
VRLGPRGRAEAFALFCILFFAALLLVGLVSINVVTYGECRAHGLSRIYCLFRR